MKHTYIILLTEKGHRMWPLMELRFWPLKELRFWPLKRVGVEDLMGSDVPTI